MHTALAGTVIFAGRLAGRGVVVVDHGDIRTTYEPVHASVAVGDVVARGAVIGIAAARRRATASRSVPALGTARAASTYLDPLVLVAPAGAAAPLDPAAAAGQPLLPGCRPPGAAVVGGPVRAV